MNTNEELKAIAEKLLTEGHVILDVNFKLIDKEKICIQCGAKPDKGELPCGH